MLRPAEVLRSPKMLRSPDLLSSPDPLSPPDLLSSPDPLRRFDRHDFPAESVAASKRGRRISVCVPAREEEATIGGVVGCVRDLLMGEVGVVDELVVIDDGSTDATAAVARDAGADVVAATDVLPEHGTEHGKGQAMWRGAHVTTGDVVVFCDADVRSFDPGFVLGLAGPLLACDDLALVKGFYDRPMDGRPGEGGRVTELAARPLISLLFPHLAGLVQPLAGECALRRDVIDAVPIVGGYGVDLGLLIDVSARFGVSSLAQCDLGVRVHRNRSLAELGAQSFAIVQVALQRAGVQSARGEPFGGTLPWSSRLDRPGTPPVDVTMIERPPLVDVRARRAEPA